MIKCSKKNKRKKYVYIKISYISVIKRASFWLNIKSILPMLEQESVT